MNTTIITIVGNVASGKTSAAPLVVDVLGANFLDADTLFQTVNPFRDFYLADTTRWALANELWLTHRRAVLLREKMLSNSNKPLVVDSGLLMSWVYAYSHFLVNNFSNDEWELYDSIYGELTEGLFDNMNVILLDYSATTLMKRIKFRGRDYELEYYTKSYIHQLQLGLKALKQMLKQRGVDILLIKEKDIKDFVNISEDTEKLRTLVSKKYTF